MKIRNIVVKAGPKALKLIQKQGFHPAMVKGIALAAGGPKWFVIYHLTRYLAAEILPKTEGKVHLLGSSVGAWQVACLATEYPENSLEKLRNNYAEEIYSMPITTHEVSRGCKASLSRTFSDKDIDFILSHQRFNVNIFAARGKWPLNSNGKLNIRSGLLINFIANAMSRRLINLSFERHVFSSHNILPIMKGGLTTQLEQLNKENFRASLMATAAIPLVMNGVDYLKGYENQTFWDGGLTDYHMVLPYRGEGVVVIPHFLPDLKPGWMDKHLWYRKGRGRQLENVLMIHPSRALVQSLPKKRITSRSDFMEYGEDQKGRADYWKQVSEMGKAMAEELHEIISNDHLKDIVIPL